MDKSSQALTGLVIFSAACALIIERIAVAAARAFYGRGRE